jgi:hypothetical protein
MDRVFYFLPFLHCTIAAVASYTFGDLLIDENLLENTQAAIPPTPYRPFF